MAEKLKVLDAPAGALYKAGATNGGHVYWVKAASALDFSEFYEKHFVKYDNGQSSVHSTIQSAINACTASVGDVVYVTEGYTQTLTTIGEIALNKAGVSVIGLGAGDSLPTITISSTDNTGSIAQSGDGSFLKDIIVVTNDDALTNAVLVTGNGCVTDIIHKDTSSTIEAANVVRLDTADNCTLRLRHLGFTGGDAGVRCVAIDDCDNVDIYVESYGKQSVAVVNMVDVASTNVKVKGNFYVSGTTDLSKDVVDTIGGSTWSVDGFDASAGAAFNGGSGNAVAAGDLSVISTAVVTTIPALAAVPSADVVTNTNERDVIGNKTDAAITTVGTTKSLMAYLKGLVNSFFALPQSVEKSDGAILNGADDIFTITGGPIKILEIVGIATVSVGAGVTNAKLQITTTDPVATTDMNAAAVDLNGAVSGTSFRSINTTAIFTMVTAGFVMEGNAFATQDTAFLCPIGTIKFTCDAARSGNIKWYVRYVPLSPSSRVVAAA